MEFVGDIFEPQSCEYTIVVHTARLARPGNRESLIQILSKALLGALAETCC